jgi:hypothetical protein
MHFLQRKASEATFYLLHHVFLPPRTPQTEDYDFEHEIFLLDEVIEALRRFRDLFTNSNFEILNTTITMIVLLKCICTSGGDVNEIELARILENLKDEGER